MALMPDHRTDLGPAGRKSKNVDLLLPIILAMIAMFIFWAMAIYSEYYH